MERTTIITCLASLTLLTASVQGASVQTCAVVELVPPVAASLAAPVSADGQPTWRIDTVEPQAWRVSLEARDASGRLIGVQHDLPGNSPATDQDLAAFAVPTGHAQSAPTVLTLVLCRE